MSKVSKLPSRSGLFGLCDRHGAPGERYRNGRKKKKTTGRGRGFNAAIAGATVAAERGREKWNALFPSKI